MRGRYCRAQAEICTKLAQQVREQWAAVVLYEMAANYNERAEKMEADDASTGSAPEGKIAN